MLNSTLVATDFNIFNSNNTMFLAEGVSGTATAGTTTNIDFLLTDDVFILGGQFSSKGSNFGDTASLQIIDVNGILSPAGTVLRTPVVNWYMNGVDGKQCDFEIKHCPQKTSGNLYLRIVYVSTGLIPVQVSAGYFFYKILI